MTVTLLFLALLPAWVTGFALVAAIAPRPGADGPDAPAREASRMALITIAAAPVGIALTSVLHFVWLCTIARTGLAYPVLEGAVVVGAVAWLWRSRNQWRPRLPDQPADRSFAPSRVGQALTVVAIGVALLLAGIALAQFMQRIPHGEWDAWAIWNVRARFLYRGGADWTAMYHPGVLGHLDYPLLQPLSIARLWHYLPGEPMVAPQMFCAALVLAGAALLAATGTFLRGALVGGVGMVALLGSLPLIQKGGTQYADTSVGMYMLASLCLLAVAHHATSDRATHRWLILAGLLAAAAAWTKNEGLAFSGVLMTSLGAVGWLCVGWRRAGRSVFAFASGWLLPIGLCVVAYKLGFAGETSLLQSESLDTMAAKVATWDRHVNIGRMSRSLLGWIPPWPIVTLGVAAALVTGLPRRSFEWHALAVVALTLLLQLALYYLIYLITPHDLTWHLQTSASRLAVQIWCMAPLLLVLLMRSARANGARGQVARDA